MAGQETLGSGPQVFHVAIPFVVRRAPAGAMTLRCNVAQRRRRLTAPRRLIPAAGLGLCMSVALWQTAVGMANFAGRLDATYMATILGLPIGHIIWRIEIRDDRFAAAATGETAGLLQVFSPGHGVAAADGTLSGQQSGAGHFMVNLSHGKASEETRIIFTGGKAREFVAHPPTPNPNLVPLTDAYRTGVVDPMSALLIRVPGSGDTATPAACERKIPVFDGHTRFDLGLVYKRLEQVRTDAGYRGPAVVCSVYFTPLAGYDPTRSALKYLQADRGMEMWLAPLAGTRLLVPFRISVPTPIGVGVLQATRFNWTQYGHSGTLNAD
jgi:hypothetical protein